MRIAVGTLYFHSPCFDGIVSAVLAWDFLEARRDWTALALHAVNYDLREAWLTQPLERPAAVVDFLYHPDTQFWADHHPTAFLSDAVRKHFEERKDPGLIYDDTAGSCAALLRERLAEVFGHRNARYAEIVRWAEKIDAARYASVEEVILSTAPALRLSRSLVLPDTAGYCEGLVRALRGKPLEEVAELPEARERFERAQELLRTGLDRFKESAWLEDDGIVLFDVDGTDAIINRYAPYYFFPEARYSAGIVRWEGGAKITAMRNPWREFPSAPLGRIAEAHGGGGHQRVGSIVLHGEQVVRAASLFREFVAEIRRREREADSADRA